MNEHTGASRLRRRPRSRRAGVLAAAVAGIVLLVAACGGGGSSAAGQSKAYQKALAFVQCMRTHGVPTFPDPASNGTVSDSQANVSSPQVLTDYGACRNLLPAGALQLSPAQQQVILKKFLKRAACMRAHGITNFPDPSMNDGLPSESLAGTGIDPNSPFFQSAFHACTGHDLRHAPGNGGGGS